MRDVSTLKPIGSAHCPQYNTEAKFYIDAAHKSGKRHLVVHYEKGGHNGAPEFVAGIPDDWSEENVIDLILRPLEDANAQFPAWEVPARAYNLKVGRKVCGRLSPGPHSPSPRALFFFRLPASKTMHPFNDGGLGRRGVDRRGRGNVSYWHV
jgi:hypothetical protein